mgnify:FL=1
MKIYANSTICNTLQDEDVMTHLMTIKDNGVYCKVCDKKLVWKERQLNGTQAGLYWVRRKAA